MSEYLTDGVHLYEVKGATENYGLARGRFLRVLDCMTGLAREMGQLEQAICRPVKAA